MTRCIRNIYVSPPPHPPGKKNVRIDRLPYKTYRALISEYLLVIHWFLQKRDKMYIFAIENNACIESVSELFKISFSC